ncbi:acetyl-CoA carboxylase, carboxyltransferase subunit beta [Fusobacterium polymorphum]
MSILKNLAKNLGLTNITQSKKKYATVGEKKSDEERESAKYKVKNIDNLKEDEVTKCPSCGVLSHKSEIKDHMKMCPNCNHYFNMSARERIELLIDEGTFKEEDATLTAANPIDFPEYTEKYEKAQHDSGLNEGVISGIGEINGLKISIACMDFNFMGGSMGSVVGEKITAALERAIEHKIPAVVVAISGGARMQEGLTSLMQMAKTSAAVKKMRLAGLPFISVPVNPTTGGVTASFAMLGDIIISEPKARIGFAGPRVIEQTIRQKLPENFQKSEFLQECGMVDVIAKREDLKATIFKVLNDII